MERIYQQKRCLENFLKFYLPKILNLLIIIIITNEQNFSHAKPDDCLNTMPTCGITNKTYTSSCS